MAQLIVTVNKLNKRNAVPSNFADKRSVIGVVNRGFRFEGVEVTDVPNAAAGKWYKDRDNSFYWGGGLTEIPPVGGVPAAVAAPVAAGPAIAGPVAAVPAVAAPEAAAPVAAVPAVVVPPVAAPVIGSLLLGGIPTFQWLMDLRVDAIWSDPDGSKGEGVKIAVLDSGYNVLNTDLKPTGVGVVGLTPPLEVTDVSAAAINDADGHGSFCAGLLSGRNEQFVVGMAPASDLLVIKVTPDGSFDRDGLEVIFAGIQMALDNGAEIISISQSLAAGDLKNTPGYLDQMQQKLNAMLAGRNVLVFAACGNNIPGEVLTAERYPASLDGCISVGATDQGQLSDITVRSSKTIIHAQGVGISSYLLGVSPEQRSGTSYSTPIVAGIAALAVSKLKRRHGGWDAGTLLKVLEDGDPIVGQAGRTLISPTRIFQNAIFQ